MRVHFGGRVTFSTASCSSLRKGFWLPWLTALLVIVLPSVALAQQATLIVSNEIKDHRFTIKTDKPAVKVSWQVTGVLNAPPARPVSTKAREEKAEQPRAAAPER